MRLMTIAMLLFWCVDFFAQASYNGQMVANVELISNPYTETKDLGDRVQQKAKQPYSQQKVEASIAALMQTGRFSSVHTEVHPDPEGLRLRFILEPAYYYGLLQFPGIEKRFSYTRLLQVVNLPDQEPYEPNGITKGQTSLLDFLHHNGYFDARVDPKANLDSVHGLANVDFSTDPGRRAKIGSVRVQGPPDPEAARILGITRSLRAKLTGAALTSGKPYTPKRLDSATRLIKKDLTKRGFLANRINIEMLQYHPDIHRADLNIQVDERRKIDIQIAGARLSWIPFLSGRREHKLLPFYEEGAFDLDLVEEGRRNLLNYFQGKGYFDAQVKTTVQRKPQETFLVYEVNKGKKHRVEEVKFRGNHNIDGDELVQQVAVKKGRFLISRGRYSYKLVQQSVKTLTAYYQNRGYEDVKIDPQVIDREPKISVIFNVAEGEQTRVTSVRVTGQHHLSMKEIEPDSGWQVREGGPFSPNGLTKDRGQILAAYLDRGYLAAQVKTNINRHSEDKYRVDVDYDISEGQQVQISDLVIAGAPHTRRSLINKSANLWTESPLSQSSLLEAESRLYNENIFDYASVGPKRPIQDQTDEMVVMKLHEAKRNTMTYGFGFEITRRGGNVPTGTVAVPGLPPVGLGNAKILPSEQTFASPRGSFEFIRRNLRGLGETGTIALLAARLRQRLVITYADPHFRGSSWRSLLSLSGERSTENPLFASTAVQGSWQFERTIDRDRTTTAQVRYSFGRTSLRQLLIPDLVLPEDRNVRLSTFSGTIIRDTRDKPLDAHRGWYQTGDFGVTAEALGASATFARFLGQTAYYKPLPHNLVFANSLRLGLAKAIAGSRIPTSERFFSGGGTSLRGFTINGAGPQRSIPVCSNPSDTSTCSNITVPVGGNMLFVLNSELRFPISVMANLGGVVFYDGGNVFSNINLSRFADNYSNTVGFGIRYSTPIGPIRFDIGHNLDPVPGIRATQFFVTLGQAF